MRLLLVTDAWEPQVNGVVTTLVELVREMRTAGHIVEVVHPGYFKTRPCPGYAGIDLAVRPKKELKRLMRLSQPDSVHIATEGPLGWAARSICIEQGWQFTTAYHTRFPEILKAALKLPLSLGYALFKHFHKHSSGVMVPTLGVQALLEEKGFKNLKSWTHGVDVDLFQYAEKAGTHSALAHLPKPVGIFVGRVSYEKNIETFLQMPFHGSKVVCGVGPLANDLQARYPGVTWLGLLSRPDLAKIYAAADVFVFPSRNETFGLVMIEAMACGTPVAAFPVDGPTEVLTQRSGEVLGGVLQHDLAQASKLALLIPRAQARARAMDFSWKQACQLFLSNLVPARVFGKK